VKYTRDGKDGAAENRKEFIPVSNTSSIAKPMPLQLQ
jgi:hypothetical protein